ncbi:UNKNOWN [Stylonychia lemnae]|uniref:Uncharacterized protein n=1 Tax=Stylonychia lemnae TaxID=5949 RepID=A0A077ZWP0_STYLE|nr:UNKNOWN [Stylonychia lemnae]|eukprot:CDW74006.1 UNKNOWN [Stylonychia lemnae]
MVLTPLYGFMTEDQLGYWRLISAIIITFQAPFDLERNLFSFTDKYWFFQNMGLFNAYGGTFFLGLSQFTSKSNEFFFQLYADWYIAALSLQSISVIYCIYSGIQRLVDSYNPPDIPTEEDSDVIVGSYLYAFKQIVKDPRVLLSNSERLDQNDFFQIELFILLLAEWVINSIYFIPSFLSTVIVFFSVLGGMAPMLVKPDPSLTVDQLYQNYFIDCGIIFLGAEIFGLIFYVTSNTYKTKVFDYYH